jgi:hypothetical protein
MNETIFKILSKIGDAYYYRSRRHAFGFVPNGDARIRGYWDTDGFGEWDIRVQARRNFSDKRSFRIWLDTPWVTLVLEIHPFGR